MKFGPRPHLHLSHIHRPHVHLPHMHRDWHAFEPVLRVCQIVLLVVLALPFAQFVAKSIVWLFERLFG